MTMPTRINGTTVEHLDRACLGKNRYPDLVTTCAAGAHYIERGQIEALWWYRCKFCGGFHLTSQDRGKKRNVMYLVKDLHAVWPDKTDC